MRPGVMMMLCWCCSLLFWCYLMLFWSDFDMLCWFDVDTILLFLCFLMSAWCYVDVTWICWCYVDVNLMSCWCCLLLFSCKLMLFILMLLWVGAVILICIDAILMWLLWYFYLVWCILMSRWYCFGLVLMLLCCYF